MAILWRCFSCEIDFLKFPTSWRRNSWCSRSVPDSTRWRADSRRRTNCSSLEGGFPQTDWSRSTDPSATHAHCMMGRLEPSPESCTADTTGKSRAVRLFEDAQLIFDWSASRWAYSRRRRTAKSRKNSPAGEIDVKHLRSRDFPNSLRARDASRSESGGLFRGSSAGTSSWCLNPKAETCRWVWCRKALHEMIDAAQKRSLRADACTNLMERSSLCRNRCRTLSLFPSARWRCRSLLRGPIAGKPWTRSSIPFAVVAASKPDPDPVVCCRTTWGNRKFSERLEFDEADFTYVIWVNKTVSTVELASWNQNL